MTHLVVGESLIVISLALRKRVMLRDTSMEVGILSTALPLTMIDTTPYWAHRDTDEQMSNMLAKNFDCSDGYMVTWTEEQLTTRLTNDP